MEESVSQMGAAQAESANKVTWGKIDLNKICKDFGIRAISYKNAREIIDRIGLNPHETPGIAFSVEDGPRVILFDDDRPAQEVRFIVAHELGHHLLGHLDYRQEDGKVPDYAESEANHFAVSLFTHDIICRYGKVAQA